MEKLYVKLKYNNNPNCIYEVGSINKNNLNIFVPNTNDKGMVVSVDEIETFCDVNGYRIITLAEQVRLLFDAMRELNKDFLFHVVNENSSHLCNLKIEDPESLLFYTIFIDDFTNVILVHNIKENIMDYYYIDEPTLVLLLLRKCKLDVDFDNFIERKLIIKTNARNF